MKSYQEKYAHFGPTLAPDRSAGGIRTGDGLIRIRLAAVPQGRVFLIGMHEPASGRLAGVLIFVVGLDVSAVVAAALRSDGIQNDAEVFGF